MVGETPGMYIAGSVGLLIASLATCFHYLTVEDQGELLAIRFGPVPLFHRRVRYADIKSVQIGFAEKRGNKYAVFETSEVIRPFLT